MDNIEQKLAIWRTSQVTSISRGGLITRNLTVYKWIAPFRCWVLREAAFWRMTDLLIQSFELHQQSHGLGARILLRSSFETLAVLLYLNHKMQKVIDGSLDFHEFNQITRRLAAGTKWDPDGPESINVKTMIDKGDIRYPGLSGIYGQLCESAHPNFDGMLGGYSKVDHEAHELNFSNRWMDLSRFRAAPSARLSDLPFESDRAFPAQC